MKTLIFILLLTFIGCFSGYAQTVVQGSIFSITGDPLPVATIDVSATGPTDIFKVPGKQTAESNGRYRIEFNSPGIYQLSVRGVFHRSVSLPIMILDQDEIDLTIYLVPAEYKSGRHFDKNIYLHWIRVYGSFNDYDFFSGISFKANNDGSISAFIKTDKDTIRYQITGLSNGKAVLPGADNYAARDNSFEAVLYNTSGADSIELRYHPDESLPYEFEKPDGLQTWHWPLSALLHFKKPTDNFWVEPLQQTRTSSMDFRTLSDSEVSDMSTEMLQDYLYEGDNWRSITKIVDDRESVIKALQQLELHPQQRSALLISYVGLIDQQIQRTEFLTRFGEEPVPLNVNASVLKETVETVDPRNPVWAINSDAALTLLEQSGYSDMAIDYAEQMIKQHADDMVVRNLVLKLIERRADEFRDIRDMPYYNWILERYGENNLARRAIATFERVRLGR